MGLFPNTQSKSLSKIAMDIQVSIHDLVSFELTMLKILNRFYLFLSIEGGGKDIPLFCCLCNVNNFRISSLRECLSMPRHPLLLTFYYLAFTKHKKFVIFSSMCLSIS